MAFELTHDQTVPREISVAAAVRASDAGSASETQMVELVRHLVEIAALDEHSFPEEWLFPKRVKQWLMNGEYQ